MARYGLSQQAAQQVQSRKPVWLSMLAWIATAPTTPTMTSIHDYDYELPRELIAQHPLPNRADARLLVVDRRTQSWESTHVRELPTLLNPGDVLVLNDTRVIPARLLGYRKQTRGRWEGLFLEASPEGIWKVLSKTRGKLRPGETVVLQDRMARDGIELAMLSPLSGGIWAARPLEAAPFLDLLQRYGRVPLPPYIRDGNMLDEDVERYQTVFAKHPGSVAAPTAGLHFTPPLLDAIRQRGVTVEQVTLHVGIGTFRPVATETLEEHRMHAEWGQVSAEVARRLRECRAAGGRVLAVGTTVVRLLESATSDAGTRPWQGSTDLFIRPPYEFRAIDSLLTNFHLPRSTLLVLVGTFGGDDLIRRAYQYAVAQRYRFYSYGDAMLIL